MLVLEDLVVELRQVLGVHAVVDLRVEVGRSQLLSVLRGSLVEAVVEGAAWLVLHALNAWLLRALSLAALARHGVGLLVLLLLSCLLVLNGYVLLLLLHLLLLLLLRLKLLLLLLEMTDCKLLAVVNVSSGVGSSNGGGSVREVLAHVLRVEVVDGGEVLHDLVLADGHLDRGLQRERVHQPVHRDVLNHLLQAQVLHRVALLAQQLSPLGVLVDPSQSLIWVC